MGKTIPLLIGLFVLTVFLSGAGTVCLAKDQPPFTADELDLFLYDYQAHLVQEQSEDATEGVYPSDPTYRNERYQYIKNRIETVRAAAQFRAMQDYIRDNPDIPEAQKESSLDTINAAGEIEEMLSKIPASELELIESRLDQIRAAGLL